MKRIFISILFLLFAAVSYSQSQYISWSHSVHKTQQENVYDIRFTANIDSPWHLYDLGPYEGGPLATEFTFEDNPEVELIGEVKQDKEPKKIHDKIFNMEISYYVQSASFTQRVKVYSKSPTELKASVLFQLCDDQSCLMPEDMEFSVRLDPVKEVAVSSVENPEEEQLAEVYDSVSVAQDKPKAESNKSPIMDERPQAESYAPEESYGFWGIILEAILWGFVALLTPCVFPMVPMTVSFFLKGSENKARGRYRAALYGLFIILLYTVPIAVVILMTYLVGGAAVTADIFNWLATHWLPNVLFFLVFMVFAASFFGAFELRLPGRLVNKSDRSADKGGLLGVFFMALTLVLVSFSCTGPIVGTILLKSTQGEIWEPIITMFAFSVAFAIPFVLFALFPSLLSNLPKSGGWLNSVKVTLGFLEVALGLKFLSVADQTYHWGILDREVYLAIWIVVFTLLGFYLLGKIKFKHDSEVKYIGITRLGLAILTFSFVVYMIPGMWGAPLKALSGYLPPMTSQDFVLNRTAASGNISNDLRPKYSEFLHLPHGLTGFFDYDEALEYSRKAEKPLFVDFTGHGCVNCREMEAKVWSDPEVLRLLNEEYVIIALYSDDRKELPKDEWIMTDSGKTLKTLGRVNSYFANTRFGVNAQPYYMILDGEENLLVRPRGYNLDIPAFVAFLKDGVEAYKSSKTGSR